MCRGHGCAPEGHHSRHRGYHPMGLCACHCGPRFWTKEEKLAWLEQDLEGLRAEAQAVEERIAEMKEEQ